MSAERSLKIDWTACHGRGLCTDLLPELLEPDPWGFPKLRDDGTGVPGRAVSGVLAAVPEQLEPHARRAVQLCPRLALRLGGE